MIIKVHGFAFEIERQARLRCEDKVCDAGELAAETYLRGLTAADVGALHARLTRDPDSYFDTYLYDEIADAETAITADWSPNYSGSAGVMVSAA